MRHEHPRSSVRDWLSRNDATTATLLFGIGGAIFLALGIVGVLLYCTRLHGNNGRIMASVSADIYHDAEDRQRPDAD